LISDLRFNEGGEEVSNKNGEEIGSKDGEKIQ
jgi:hypothetical protein